MMTSKLLEENIYRQQTHQRAYPENLVRGTGWKAEGKEVHLKELHERKAS